MLLKFSEKFYPDAVDLSSMHADGEKGF